MGCIENLKWLFVRAIVVGLLHSFNITMYVVVCLLLRFNIFLFFPFRFDRMQLFKRMSFNFLFNVFSIIKIESDKMENWMSLFTYILLVLFFFEF